MSLKNKLSILLFIVSLFMFMMPTSDNIASANPSHLLNTFNFSDIEESENFYTDLDGNWNFFENELLTPEEVKEQLAAGEGRLVSIPASFEKQTGEKNLYGTYSVTIKIPEKFQGEIVSIHVPYQYSAYVLYADDEEIAENGVVGEDADSHISEMAPRRGDFVAQSDEVLLTMQVSSFEHIRGGFENSIYLGETSIVERKYNLNMIATLFINGSIFIIGLFMVLFSLFRRKEILFLLFGMFAMLISARALFTVPFYYTSIFTNISWLWGTRIEYILTEATSMFFIILLWKWHEKEFSRKIMYGMVIIHLMLIITTLFTKPVLFQTLFFNIFYLAIPTFFYLIYVISKSIRNNNKDAKINLIGMGLIFLAFFNDFAIGQNWYQSVPLMLPAVGIYVLIHVFLMSRNFAESIHKTEEQNRRLLELNASNEDLAIKLQKEIKQKDDFLANTSHELRNPLHGIINIGQSILHSKSNSNLNEKIRNDLELQLTIGHHMSRTLEDLLDITRLKEHRIQLTIENLNIQGAAIGVVDMLSVLIGKKDIQMKVRIPNDFPNVAADKNRLIQILFNLLHNAVKYTDEGMITVDADIKEGKAHIHITDTGIGMNEKVLQAIFEPYKQGDSSITSIGTGLGLGLHICKQLVEMHDGTIEVSSVVGEGSIFTFTLPLADTSCEEQTEEATESSAEENKFPVIETPITMNHAVIEAFKRKTTGSYRPRILAVDDDPVNLQVLTNILTDDQYELETVTGGKEALKQLENEEWDLVISDVMMPSMSGYDLTRTIREIYSVSELPILLLTARSNPEDIYTGFLAGANDYVTKPVDAVELNVRVSALTDLQASIDERLRMEAAWLQAQIRPHFLLNTLNAIISLSVIDIKRMTQLLEKFAHYLQNSFYLKNLEQVVPLQLELDLVESYLYIEKERFGDRLQTAWERDEDNGVMIPPLAIQTLVENAVNHGVLNQEKGGLVTIRVKTKKDCTEISVIDNGIGMDEEKIKQIFTVQPDRKKGIGIINTQQRLIKLYGKGLYISSKVGEGTNISFTVPADE